MAEGKWKGLPKATPLSMFLFACFFVTMAYASGITFWIASAVNFANGGLPAEPVDVWDASPDALAVVMPPNTASPRSLTVEHASLAGRVFWGSMFPLQKGIVRHSRGLSRFALEAAFRNATAPKGVLLGMSSSDASGVVEFSRLPFFIEALPFFLLSILFEVALSLVNPDEHHPHYTYTDTINSLSAGLVNQSIGKAGSLLGAIPYMWIYSNLRITDIFDPTKQGESGIGLNVVVWFLGIVLTDFFYYWYHRSCHETNLLWGSHVTHHSGSEMNLATALRQTAYGFDSAIFYFPLALFLPPSVAMGHKAINTIGQYHIHTRFIDRYPAWFEFLFNTPSHHRVHHGRNPYAIDKNYGGIFIIFDRLFGTFAAERDDEELHYGIVPPLESFNPVDNQLSYLERTWKRMFKIGGWQGLKLWFLAPNKVWNRKEQAWKEIRNPLLGRRVNPWHKPFPSPPTPVVLYTLTHFTVALASYFLQVLDPKFATKPALLLSGTYLVFALWGVGLLHDGSKYSQAFEVTRNLVIALACIGVLANALQIHPDLRIFVQSKDVVLAIGAFHTLSILYGYHFNVFQPRVREADVLFTNYKASIGRAPPKGRSSTPKRTKKE